MRSGRKARGSFVWWLAPVLGALLLGGSGPEAVGQRVLFPDTPAGWEAQLRDPKDVAPYLAYHKARAAERMQVLATRQTPNQDAYDALYYDLDLGLNPQTRVLTGTVTVVARVVAGPLATIDLDLDNLMTVSAVTSGGAPATYTHLNDILTVNLDHAYQTGQEITVVVHYSGNPQAGGSFGWDTWAGSPMIWTLSEPFGARTWWPCKDYPNDKADSLDIRITAPTGLITASNGSLVEMSDDGTTAVARWKERYPIATYLVSLASHPYTTYSDYYVRAPGDSMEVKFFIFPDDYEQTLALNLMTKDIIGGYEQIFGPYPFYEEKYGHAEFLWGGAMEHQTCTSMGFFGESVIAHELSHQWWGDLVTCDTFNHVWLNEGFATYSEALWFELTEGPSGLHEDMSFNTYYGPGTIYVPDLSDWNRIFDSNLSYNKASWVLHMLRHVIGDEAFFGSLDAYYQQYRYASATTEQFRDVCETVSGQDLDAFFQQWIYGEYYPKYSYTYEVTPVATGYDVLLTLEQIQTWQLFTMPVDVTIETAGGEQTFVVQDSQASQQFVLHVDEAPTAVRIDKDQWILKTVEEPVLNPPFDRGVLLVNGVDWDSYGSESYTAYQDKAFWGDYTIDFWDLFSEPAGGYPATLPDPIGRGSIPGDVIGHYRNVIWIGNNFNGDLTGWVNSPIKGYLEAGGNVMLLTRMGDSFLDAELQSYLGITWSTGTTIFDCAAVYPGLTNIGRIGTQSYCPIFDMILENPESRLLYLATQNYTPDRGIGVWRRNSQGGIYRPNGAQFIFLSGRPYRWNHTDLKNNIMYMLEHMFLEPVVPTGAEDGVPAVAALRLEPARPNPTAAGTTTLRFVLPQAGKVTLTIVDVAGRRVRGILDANLPAGPHDLVWSGNDDRGRAAPAGTYWARLQSGSRVLTQKFTILR